MQGRLCLLIALTGCIVASETAGPIQAGSQPEAIDAVQVATPPRLVVGDEIDALAEELQPPLRFAGHQADWRVEWRSFSFAHHGETRDKRYRVVLDGDRVVALLRSGDILLIAATPDSAPRELALPTERMHLDNLPGPSLPTWPFIRKVKTHGSIYQESGEQVLPRERFEVSDGHLAYIRSQDLPEYRVEARFVFTTDPVFGYRVDGIRELSFAALPAPDTKLGAGTFTPGCYVPWSYAAHYHRTAYTPSAGGIRGWANNLVCMDRADADRDTFDWRDGGFIAYLPGPEDWSVCFTRQDGAGPSRRLSVCNAHNDFHITLHLPELTETDAEGRYPYRYVHRLLHLPPELSASVWERVELLGQGQHTVVIKLGQIEDFEDQPVPLTEAARGLVWTSGWPAVVEGIARSGEYSLLIDRHRSWPNLPQVSLLPGKRYRLAGWFKVQPWTEEQWATAKEREARRRSKAITKGKEPPPVTDWEAVTPRAYISGDFYEWSPYSGDMLKRQRTTIATSDSDDWQPVTLEFTAPDWGPFINIAFHAEYCQAYLDDFVLQVIDEP